MTEAEFKSNQAQNNRDLSIIYTYTYRNNGRCEEEGYQEIICAEETGEISADGSIQGESGPGRTDGLLHGVCGAREATVRDKDGICQPCAIQDAAGRC